MKVSLLTDLNAIIELRQKVLHPHGDRSKVSYLRDKDPLTQHYGCYFNQQLIATGTMIAEDEAEAASLTHFRIRGMAVDPRFQGQGLGQLILTKFFEFLKTQPQAELLWCNARLKALKLYTRFGFEVFEPEFDIPGSGPHKRLRLQLKKPIKI